MPILLHTINRQRIQGMSHSRTVLVTGATGKQGGAVAKALIERGHAVRAMTRTPDNEAATRLAGAGAAIVRGDFADPHSLAAAMAGADTVFVMGTPYEAGPAAEATQGIAAIEAARRAGVGHVIYSSVASANRNTGIPHFDSKFAVERHLTVSGLNWTVVAPVAFMDFLAATLLDGLRAGELRFPPPADRTVQYVAVSDIGRVVAELASQREAAFAQRIELAGDERTGAEVAAVLSRAAGRDLRYVPLPLDAVRAFSEDLALMLDWLNRVGYHVDLAALRAAFRGVRWQSVEDWAAEQDWQGALAEARAPSAI